MKKIAEKLFSVKIEKMPNRLSRKVITILGIKIKINNVKENDIREISNERVFIINRNTVKLALLSLKNIKDDSLLCLKGEEIIFIFHKNSLCVDNKFFIDFLTNHVKKFTLLELSELEKNSVLYKEHITRVKNNEFCWKYVNRGYFISETYLSYKNSNIYINSSYIDETENYENGVNAHFVRLQSSRKYVEGVTVADYMKTKNEEEQLQIFDKLYDYVCTTYSDEEYPNKISKKLSDCHLYNFIIDSKGAFHFIDFDMESSESLDKEYCIFRMLYYDFNNLYKIVLKKYGLEDKHKLYEEFNQEKIPCREMTDTEIFKHDKLCKKYFSELSFCEQYNI